MALNQTQIDDITNTITAFVPIMLLVSIVGWLLDVFQSGF